MAGVGIPVPAPAIARLRGQSIGEGPNKVPHTVSLKVLRLTRPSISSTYIPPHTERASQYSLSPLASLPYPSAETANDFILSPVLTLPESFQSAYVGEIFGCTICANNELSPDDKWRRIDSVKIRAEIQRPSNPSGAIVDFDGEDDSSGYGADDGKITTTTSSTTEKRHTLDETISPGESLQKILKINLQEAGNHVLAITVTYTETLLGASGAAGGGRVRTFRKLYQFVAQNLIGVRTKAGDFITRKNGGGGGKRWCAIEAQLENLGERAISLEAVTMMARRAFRAKSLNWDVYGSGGDVAHAPVLNPRDVMQVAFVVEEVSEETEEKKQNKDGDDVEQEDDEADKLRVPEGKVVLGRLKIQWRAAMGDRGELITGWLLAKT